MGGDLNLKKSWHPHLRKNQEKVWKEESAALAERKVIEKLRKEREEERAIEELQKLQEANGGKVAIKRVDWMYSGPSGDGNAVTEEREGYLLGKRRIDSLLKANDTASQSLTKGAAASIDTLGNGNANSARDVQMKVAQDPLLAIQKQKMEMQLKMMREVQKKAKSEEKRAKEKEREKKHKHSHSRRDRSRSRDSSDERERRHRHRHRSRSRERRRDRDDRDDRDKYRRRKRSYSRDSSDERNRRHRHRSRSPYRRDRDDRDDHRRRSRSPRRREDRPDRDNYRKRSQSPYRSKDRGPRDDYPPRPRPSAGEEPAKPTESAADRLARMQADASSLEEQRIERVRQMEAQDAVEQERRKKEMDKGQRFISSMRTKAAENMDLGDVMARGRQGFKREADD